MLRKGYIGISLFVICLTCAAGAVWPDDPLVMIEKIEGAGVVEVGVGGEEINKLEAEGKLTVGYLQDKGLLPDRFWTVISNAEAGKTDICPWTVSDMKGALLEGEKAVNAAKAGVDMAKTQYAAAGDNVSDEAKAQVTRAEASLVEAEKGLKQFRALYEFMEARSYLTWRAAKVKDALPAGAAIRTGGGSEAVLRYNTGAVTRVLENSTFVGRPLVLEQAPMSVVYGRLWRGICNFYFPPGGEGAKKFEVDTERVVVGIKGTEFVVKHIEGASTVTVSKGSVEVRDKKTGEVKVISAGESMAFGAPAIGGAIPKGWARETKGPLSFARPGDWTAMPMEDPLQGAWTKGDPSKPDAALGVLRGASFEQFLAGTTVEKRETITVSGRPATKLFVKGDQGGPLRGWFVQFAAPDADGQTTALVFLSPEKLWPEYEKTYQMILDSFSGGATGGDNPSRPPDTVVVDTPKMPDMEEHTVGAITIPIPKDWKSVPAEGLAEAAWIVGDVNEPDVAVSVWSDQDASVLTKAFPLSNREPMKIDGRAATKYAIKIVKPAIKGWFILFDTPDPDGCYRAVVLAGPDAKWATYEATLTKIAESIRTQAPPRP